MIFQSRIRIRINTERLQVFIIHKDKFVFAQLVEYLDNNKFRRLADK